MRAVQSAENFQNKMAMEGVPGSLGTSVGFSLRIGQTLFSSASLLFMSLGVEFYSYSAFCYLVTTMGLVIPWSCTLAVLDGYSVVVKCPVHQPGILFIIAAGDWVLSVLTLAAACSTASVVDLLFQTSGSFCTPKCCGRYQLSAAMAFLTWFLSLASALLNLWLLPSSIGYFSSLHFDTSATWPNFSSFYFSGACPETIDFAAR
ncbi:hypothetical protein ES332_A01G215300v1 [Gossypium tomentosum]|nr:hypothetical protein ES332_A01G215300v1 [Gossypium tomentosum]